MRRESDNEIRESANAPRAWRSGRVLVPILLIFSLLCGCSPGPHPDLLRLYAREQAEPGAIQPPVILIPGVLGSRLSDATGRERWIGSLGQALFSDYADLALDFDPLTLRPRADDLQVSGLTDAFAGRDFYRSIQRTLEQAGQYQLTRPGSPVDPRQRHYYVFGYDWRQDNVQSARALDALIEQIRQDYQAPDLKVDIIAHSMGGLITRYYLRYGTQDVLNDNDFPLNYHGASRLRRVVLLGTPNLGSVNALHAFLEGRKVGLSRIRTETLATFPSLYQLFPHPLNDWIMTSAGTSLQRDLFDVSLWRRFQWSIFDPQVRQRILQQHQAGGQTAAQAEQALLQLEQYFAAQLERARRFVWSLTLTLGPRPPEQDWRLVVFGGDCTLTPARVLVEEVNGESELRLWPDEITQPVAGIDYSRLMLLPGDGAVTKASLLARERLDPSLPRHRYSDFPLAYPLFLCEEHDTLTTNVFFQDNLLHFLLSQGE